jgi:tetratricopeptide (TPR) repeat protein
MMTTGSSNVRTMFRAALAMGVLAGAAASASAAGIPGYPENIREYDAREVSMLPRYCVYTQDFRNHIPGGGNLDEIRRWRSKMGNAFEAMHHYCWGLMETNRAMLLARNPQDRKFYLGSAIGNFDYVIHNSPPDFIMLPEILTRKGENLLRLGRSAQAVQALEQAIALKSDYWPPYAQLSDFYKANGDPGKARETLEKGLALTPDAKALNRRLVELKDAKPKQ